MDKTALINLAVLAQKMAYAPYSGFAVGAALLTKSNKIYTGVNIENAAYSPTNCAERTAFFKAVSEGEREFTAIALVGGAVGEDPTDYCTPCGVCRQVMVEFCEPDFMVLCAKSVNDFKEYTLEEMLPMSFSNKSLK